MFGYLRTVHVYAQRKKWLNEKCHDMAYNFNFSSELCSDNNNGENVENYDAKSIDCMSNHIEIIFFYR